MFKTYGELALRAVESQLCAIVAKLASIGLSHNDLYPRNVIVGRKWEILAILDWDESGSLITSREYSRRVCWEFDTHDWDYIFRPYCPDSFDFLDLQLNDNLHVQPPLVWFPPGHVVGPLTEDKLYIKHSISGGARLGVDMKDRNGNEERQGKKGSAKYMHSGDMR
jgi:hypothetical protein